MSTFICDVINDVTQEGNDDEEILRLTLNTLFAISKGIKPLEQIRAVFEIRLAAELGFSPSLDGCHICGKNCFDTYYFDIIDGVISCGECKSKANFSHDESPFAEKGINKPLSVISANIVAAISYIISARQERILSFTIDDCEWTSLYEVAEKFLLNHLERGFYSLDFYKSMLF